MEKPPTVEHVEAQQTLQDAGHLKSGARVEAVEAENNEHQMGFWEALKTFPKASFWALVMCFTIVESRRSTAGASRRTLTDPFLGHGVVPAGLDWQRCRRTCFREAIRRVPRPF